jgi:hypothetical protein
LTIVDCRLPIEAKMGLFEKLLLETSPGLALVIVVGFLIWKLGTLAITKYFEVYAPLAERQTRAIERLALVGESMTEEMKTDHRTLFGGLRAVNWEIQRLRTSPVESGGVRGTDAETHQP